MPRPEAARGGARRGAPATVARRGGGRQAARSSAARRWDAPEVRAQSRASAWSRLKQHSRGILDIFTDQVHVSKLSNGEKAKGGLNGMEAKKNTTMRHL